MEMPSEDLDELLLRGKPIIISVGSATVLAEISRNDRTLTIHLAHIDGGGEGILPLFIGMARQYAVERKFSRIEWIVLAANCARPNPKLLRFLELKGFVLRRIDGLPEDYHRIIDLS
ncbi:MAG: hypothetical protein ABIR47_12325 [Candidatus Kapaibacterium sp.]